MVVRMSTFIAPPLGESKVRFARPVARDLLVGNRPSFGREVWHEKTTGFG